MQHKFKLGALAWGIAAAMAFPAGAAAAIGVPEGISVILREAAVLPALGDRLIVFATGIVLFGVPLQLGLAFMRWLQRELGPQQVEVHGEKDVGNPLGDPQHRADEHRETEAEDGTADEDRQNGPPPLLGRSHRLGG